MSLAISATLPILCGLLSRAASAAPLDYYSAHTPAPDTPTGIIGVDEVWAQSQGVPEPTTLLLLASALLLMWAVTRLHTIRRKISIK